MSRLVPRLHVTCCTKTSPRLQDSEAALSTTEQRGMCGFKAARLINSNSNATQGVWRESQHVGRKTRK